MTVAEVVSGLGFLTDEFICRFEDSIAVGIGQNGGAVFNQFHPFGLWTQHHATFAAEVGLLLQAAAVGQYQSCLLQCRQGFQIGKGLDEVKGLVILKSRSLEVLKSLSSPGVYGEKDSCVVFFCYDV